jgi:hypothetical protein
MGASEIKVKATDKSVGPTRANPSYNLLIDP